MTPEEIRGVTPHAWAAALDLFAHADNNIKEYDVVTSDSRRYMWNNHGEVLTRFGSQAQVDWKKLSLQTIIEITHEKLSELQFSYGSKLYAYTFFLSFKYLYSDLIIPAKLVQVEDILKSLGSQT